MKLHYKVLNSKERKQLLGQLEKQFGCDTTFLKEYAFLLKEKKKRVYVTRKEVLAEDIENLRVDALGLYLGTLIPNGEMRLSIEGSQLLGPHAKKNLLALNDAQAHDWVRGATIDLETDERGFFIITHNTDFLGCGKPVLDEKTGTVSLHNYVPKTRYVRSAD